MNSNMNIGGDSFPKRKTRVQRRVVVAQFRSGVGDSVFHGFGVTCPPMVVVVNADEGNGVYKWLRL
jgi:hypothetical protein